MDPDVCLAQIREHLASVLAADNLIDEAIAKDDHDSAMEYRNQREDSYELLTVAVFDMDEWLSKGGYLPKAWQRLT